MYVCEEEGVGGRSQGEKILGPGVPEFLCWKLSSLLKKSSNKKLALLSCPASVTPFVHQEHCHLHRQQGTLIQIQPIRGSDHHYIAVLFPRIDTLSDNNKELEL